MSIQRNRFRRRLLILVAVVLAVPGPVALPVAAQDQDDADDAVHHLRIARQRPPCTRPTGLPVIPNDPGALVTGSGIRCHGTRPPELELWLPEDRYLWLDRAAPNPAAWIDLGPVMVDVQAIDDPPLGLRLTRADGGWALETRHVDSATLTRVEPGEWHEVTSPDGRRFWVVLDAPAEDRRPLGGGRVRYRAD